MIKTTPFLKGDFHGEVFWRRTDLTQNLIRHGYLDFHTSVGIFGFPSGFPKLGQETARWPSEHQNRHRLWVCILQTPRLAVKVANTLLTVPLPNLRSKPSFVSLYAALESLALLPNSWNGTKSPDPEGLDAKVVNRYLLSVVSSELAWFQDGPDEAMVLEHQDKIWDLASRRMAERCGRTGLYPRCSKAAPIPSLPLLIAAIV